MDTQRKPLLIGLTGLAGTGKDTVRLMLKGHSFIGLAFADPIRRMIRELLCSADINDACMDDRALKEQPIAQLSSEGRPVSYRMLAQTLGTEWARAIHPDFWLRIAQAYMDGIRGTTFGPLPNFVISDVRFPNEADWIRAQGGVIWRVVRPGVAPVRDHASESEIENIACDKMILNIGSVQDLHNTVLNALRNHVNEVTA